MAYERTRDEKEYFCIGITKSGVHFHRAIELVYCINVDKNVYIDGKLYTLNEGELLAVPPFMVHYFPEIEGQSSLCVTMPATYSDIFSKRIGTKQFSSPVFTDKAMSKDVFDQLMKLEHTTNSLMRDGIYRYVLGSLLEHGQFVDKEEKSKDDFAFSVLTYFENHYSEKLSLETVANALGYSRCHFSSLFKKVLRTGFCEYLSMLRVEKSLSLLGTLPINEVAYAVGFGSLQSYYTNFKRVMGVSPAVYKAGKHE